MAVLWCNGEWMEKGGFLWPMDRGSMFGLALFETILAIDGEPKFLNSHLRRLRDAHERLGWEIFPNENWDATLRELLCRNDLLSGPVRIRLTSTAGSGALNDIARGDDALTWLSAFPCPDFPETVSAMISPWKRNEQSPLTGLKCASYAENLLALDHARKAGFNEAIFFNTADRLCEAATSNIFIVRSGRVLTPPLDSGCLPGVTRSVVIDLAKNHGLTCIETPLEKIDLENADEIFLTSAIRGPMPVSRLDQRNFAATPTADSIRSWWKEEICGV